MSAGTFAVAEAGPDCQGWLVAGRIMLASWACQDAVGSHGLQAGLRFIVQSNAVQRPLACYVDERNQAAAP